MRTKKTVTDQIDILEYFLWVISRDTDSNTFNHGLAAETERDHLENRIKKLKDQLKRFK